jgi:endonuclease G
MPKFSKSLRAHIAMPIGRHEPTLDYRHFSIVMHKTRRLPIVSAVNIDGPTWKQINRCTRVVTDPYEGAEVWYPDHRLAESEQCTQVDYDAMSHLFDRGHMVRREDPQWGPSTLALEAMDDTFHFTNACPQHWKFNQRAAFWQGIENYVLDGMRQTPERVTVFTGPIFTTKDPTYGNVQVPLSFWKIVCRTTPDGSMRATGFIASQAEMIDDPREALTVRDWAIAQGEPVAAYQVSIARIERRTGITFCPTVRAADTLSTGFEALRADEDDEVRPIATAADATW